MTASGRKQPLTFSQRTCPHRPRPQRADGGHGPHQPALGQRRCGGGQCSASGCLGHAARAPYRHVHHAAGSGSGGAVTCACTCVCIKNSVSGISSMPIQSEYLERTTSARDCLDNKSVERKIIFPPCLSASRIGPFLESQVSTILSKDFAATAASA